jgi:hypothetical protein
MCPQLSYAYVGLFTTQIDAHHRLWAFGCESGSANFSSPANVLMMFWARPGTGESNDTRPIAAMPTVFANFMMFSLLHFLGALCAAAVCESA